MALAVPTSSLFVLFRVSYCCANIGTYTLCNSFFVARRSGGAAGGAAEFRRENATHAALVCHPHPLFGGTMHNKVVFHAMKALNSFGFPVLRFNFRGTGLSHGEHDYGRGEIEDVRTALEWLDREFRLPLIFAGFSFRRGGWFDARPVPMIA